MRAKDNPLALRLQSAAAKRNLRPAEDSGNVLPPDRQIHGIRFDVRPFDSAIQRALEPALAVFEKFKSLRSMGAESC